MKPYYDEAGITIYHGDCREVLDAFPNMRPELVFTSPPYNLGVSSGGGLSYYSNTVGLGGRGGAGKWSRAELANGYADHDDAMVPVEYEQWQRAVISLLWSHLAPGGAIYYNHKPRVQARTLWMPISLVPEGVTLRQIIIWARAGGINFSPTHYLPMHEWILVLAGPDFRLKSKGASGVGDVWRVPQESNTLHPAPFPLALPAMAIESTGASVVLDPFSGSGTTLRAAKDAGITGIGIELSERYCEIAARRLAQEVLDFGSADYPVKNAEDAK